MVLASFPSYKPSCDLLNNLSQGNWYDEASFGKEELWLNALEREEDGVTLSTTPVHEQALRITLASDPYFCLDACALSLKSASACAAAWVDGYAVQVSVCDETRASQEWSFNDATGEIVSMGAKALGYDYCLGWRDVLARDGYSIRLRPCGSGQYTWDPSFYVETTRNTSVHGAYYFDAYRNWNTRGVVQPLGIHELSPPKEVYKTISSAEAAKSYLGTFLLQHPSRLCLPYFVLFALYFVLAGVWKCGWYIACFFSYYCHKVVCSVLFEHDSLCCAMIQTHTPPLVWLYRYAYVGRLYNLEHIGVECGCGGQ